jgi:hypothetical protein
MTDIMISQNIDLSSWDTLYISLLDYVSGLFQNYFHNLKHAHTVVLLDRGISP